MALRENIPVLPPDASVEAISQAATVASSAVESLVETAKAGVGVRQEDLGLNIGEFDLRTLQGFDREMQRLKGELRIRLNQLTQTEKDIKDVTDHIAREDRKLQAPDATEEDLRDVRNRKKTLEDSLKTLRDQRETHLTYIREFSTELRSQVNRIRETVEKVLYGDKTLGEKIRTIFREQGVTITSLLVALSAVIAAIVEAILGSSGGGAAAAGGTSPEPGVPAKAKEYVKHALVKLAGWLKALAAKALAALPGVIGAAVSWLLKTAGNAAAWLAKNIWALVVAAVVIVLAELRSRKKV
jgi:plasmid stabilization system protein ParE